MKLLLQSAMIFFGTLMAAGMVALGEPAKADVAIARSAVATQGEQRGGRSEPGSVKLASSQAGFGPR